MPKFETWLQPKPGPAQAARESLWLATLAAMVLLLAVPMWGELQARFFYAVTARVTGWLLLPCLGFLLALRRGAVDMSVWVSAGGGGIVAASLIAGGVDGATALLAGTLCGAGLGLVNAVLVLAARLPSPLATTLTGLGGLGLLHWAWPAGGVAVSHHVFEGWELVLPASGAEEYVYPIAVTRMLLVAAGYVLVMAGLLVGAMLRRRGLQLKERWLLGGALVLSGALAAGGGALWLLDHTYAPLPSGLLGDLRIPAAALLAGCAILSGPGRTLLAGVLLPPALILANIWRAHVYVPATDPFTAPPTMLLIALVATTLAVRRQFSDRSSRAGGKLATAALVTALASLALPAASAHVPTYALAAAMARTAIAAAVASVVIMVIDWQRQAATGR